MRQSYGQTARTAQVKQSAPEIFNRSTEFARPLSGSRSQFVSVCISFSITLNPVGKENGSNYQRIPIDPDGGRSGSKNCLSPCPNHGFPSVCDNSCADGLRLLDNNDLVLA